MLRQYLPRTARESNWRPKAPRLAGLVGVLLALFPALAFAGSILASSSGATATYSVTTSKTNVNGVWRKVQAPLQEAAQYMVPEWDLLDEITTFEVDWSAREITMPLDLTDEVGIASIPEGGFEARPASPNPVDATLTWVLFNGRFTISKTAKFIDMRNRQAMLERQLIYQGRKKLQAFARRIGEYFYGTSTGVMATVSAVATDTITVQNQYNVAGLGSAAPFKAVFPFKANEWVAVINPTGPALRGIAQVASQNLATGQFTFQTGTTPAGTTANDWLVFANSLENTTLAGGTDYQNALVGLLDITTSTSIQGVSSASFPKWAAGFSDATGGRFSGIRLRKGKQGVLNNGGGTINTVFWANGVENDVTSQLQAGLRFQDAFSMEMDGMPKAKGIDIYTTRFVPDGYVFGFDKRSLRKLSLLPRPGQPAWDDGYKLQDQSGFVFPLDYPCQLVVTNRGNFAVWSGLNQQ